MLQNRGWVALAAVVLVAFFVRVWGSDFGLPYAYHVDEQEYVEDGVNYLATGNFSPTRWANPTLLKYLFSAEYAVVYLLNRSEIGSLDQLDEYFRANPTAFYQLARLTSAIFGTATVVLVYFLAIRLYQNRVVALIAALLLALCFLHARDSHYAVSDVPAAFFFTAVVLCSVAYLQTQSPRVLYAAGILTGMAVATKYTSALVIGVILLAWFLAHFSGNWRTLPGLFLRRSLIIAFVLMGMTFLVFVPFSVLDLPDFIQNLRDHYGMGQTGFAGFNIDPAGGFAYYLKTLWWGVGPALSIAAPLAILYALYRRRKAELLLVVPIVLMYLYLGRQLAFFARFIIPILPLLLVLIAGLLRDVADRVLQRWAGTAALGLAALLVLPSALSLVQHNQLLTQPDTRTLAKTWIETNIDAGARIYQEWHTPFLATEPFPVPNSTRVFDVNRTWLSGLVEYPLEYYQDCGYEYLIASSFMYRIPRLNPDEESKRYAFYAQLDAEAELIYTLKPYSGEDEPAFVFDQLYGPTTSLAELDHPGPTIKIYRTEPSDMNSDC